MIYNNGWFWPNKYDLKVPFINNWWADTLNRSMLCFTQIWIQIIFLSQNLAQHGNCVYVTCSKPRLKQNIIFCLCEIQQGSPSNFNAGAHKSHVRWVQALPGVRLTGMKTELLRWQVKILSQLDPITTNGLGPISKIVYELICEILKKILLALILILLI